MFIPSNITVIQEETVEIDSKIFDVLELKIIPGDYSKPKNLRFNWTVTSYESTTLVL